MTGRERLLALLHRQPCDRLTWTTLVDGPSWALAPESWRADHGLAYYRQLGCDILLLNGWGTPHHYASPRLVWGDHVRVSHERGAEGLATTRYELPGGRLEAVYRHGHPVRYPVQSLAELRLLRELWTGARHEAVDDTATAQALDAALGDDGISVRFWGPSTIPALLEYWIGTEAFYLLRADHPAELDAVIHLMHEAELAAFAALAAHPCRVVMLVENTSSYYISPDLYRRHNGPHVKDFVDAMHGAGKLAFVHMCGHVKALLPQFKGIGFDGIHTLTPPPTGDTPWELALDVLGEELVIVGALPPPAWITCPVGEIPTHLARYYTPRLRRAHFLLAPMADGIAVAPERFQAIGAWIAAQARS